MGRRPGGSQGGALVLKNTYLIAGFDRAAREDFGENPQFDMAKILLEFLHRVGVAFGGVGVDGGGAAAVDALPDDEGCVADADGFAEPVEFRPGGDVFDVDIGAEAAFVARGADGGFEGVEGAEADEADDLGFVVAEAVIGKMAKDGGLAV